MARINLSKKLRFEIFKRDNFQCRYCGRTVGADIVLEADHVIPVSKGGSNDPLNLVTACFDCNRGKSKSLLSSSSIFTPNIKEKRKIIRQQKQQISALIEYRKEQQGFQIELARNALTPIIVCLENPNKDIPKNWFYNVSTFLKHMSFDEVIKAANLAADGFMAGQVRNPYLYFCAVCWRSVKHNVKVGDRVHDQ